MDTIRVDIGVYTSLFVDLTEVNFTGIKEIIFTVKNNPSVKSNVIIERKFTEPKEYEITVKPEESIKLIEGAVYDFNEVLEDGTRRKMTDNGEVILRKSVGDCID